MKSRAIALVSGLVVALATMSNPATAQCTYNADPLCQASEFCYRLPLPNSDLNDNTCQAIESCLTSSCLNYPEFETCQSFGQTNLAVCQRACATDSDCAATATCYAGTCQDTCPGPNDVGSPTTCRSNEQCVSFDNGIVYLCWPSCEVAADCLVGFTCDGVLGVCVQNLACPVPLPGEDPCPCDATTDFLCVECLVDGDCLDPLFGQCDLGTNTCVPPPPPPCTADADCVDPILPICDVVTGACIADVIPPCVDDIDCLVGEVCVEGVCTLPPPPPPCLIDTDCLDVAFPICDVATGECIPLQLGCVVDADCMAPQVCVEAICVDPPAPCTTDTDCLDVAFPVCDTVTGTCVAPPNLGCMVDVDCLAGEICENNICVTPLPPVPCTIADATTVCGVQDPADVDCVTFGQEGGFCGVSCSSTAPCADVFSVCFFGGCARLCDATLAAPCDDDTYVCVAPDTADPTVTVCLPSCDPAATTSACTTGYTCDATLLVCVSTETPPTTTPGCLKSSTQKVTISDITSAGDIEITIQHNKQHRRNPLPRPEDILPNPEDILPPLPVDEL